MSVQGQLSGSVLVACDEPGCRATSYVGEGTAHWTTTRTGAGMRWDWCPDHPPWAKRARA